MSKLNTHVVLTHTEPTNLTFSTMIEINADYGNGENYAIANVFHKDVEGALSIANHVVSIPEMIKAINAYMDLQNMHHSLKDDFDIKSKEVKQLMETAHNKLNK